jgi:hypothetical protein
MTVNLTKNDGETVLVAKIERYDIIDYNPTFIELGPMEAGSLVEFLISIDWRKQVSKENEE